MFNHFNIEINSSFFHSKWYFDLKFTSNIQVHGPCDWSSIGSYRGSTSRFINKAASGFGMFTGSRIRF
jgi:hypothetical protein